MDMPSITGEIPLSHGEQIEARLVALERGQAVLTAENRALRAKLVELGTRAGGPRKGVPGDIVDTRAAPRAFVEQQSRILHTVPQLSMDLPSDAELRQLRAICAREFPAMCTSDGFVESQRAPPDPEACEEEYLLQFSRSILALSGMRKLPQPNQRIYAVGQHLDHAKTLLRAAGKYTRELRGGPFVMACFVMDVPVSGLNVDGSVLCLGLAVGDGAGQAIPLGAWRETLKLGRLPRQHPVRWHASTPSLGRVTAANVY